ncbi:glutaredoxin [Clostridium sp. Marseille-P299]|uniref:glutaredoxin n=1 Tax=Clostridium sp. Marseille-P299 TaxID=1805477 RepID=UPI00082C8B41|nr:glutaredoxin [Clostridium sp. Marseille-P299]
MKITMYGAPICGDCVAAKEQLMKCEGIELNYRNITESTTILKEFLAYRDHESMFKPVIQDGKIGIPFFILEDGTKTFDYSKFVDVNQVQEKKPANACSIDGKGVC